ncbi:hypothetical protein Cylst_0082 [Cylindrospermum stagnale PCC 7417]|uniref:Uncharacterized protein n=1 Tax=Cylindrospermum stagnale PCC 7417 TaxID=56107 RepID=K9WSD7_9NOST|nr:hypothetical protein [Cylindrospermum stagnale]AFZ22462.1 hypothetical protein Cylst_0082 [Cylindrospermum stagnale PCC 7417]
MKLTTLIKSALMIASIALLQGIASAQTPTSNNIAQAINPAGNSLNVNHLKPFNVAFLAYQGYLKEQGIPSASALIFEYQTGKLTAEDVVKAAIKANKLPAQVLNDQSYLNAVESQLASFADDSSN